jgi:nucleotidyltransferase substrate binding protein (TIGR01987 family)
MIPDLKYSVGKLQNAFNILNEGISKCKDDLDKDGVIQRFKYTFELLWKTMKIFLEDQGILCNSPKEVVKSAFKFGLFEDEDTFLKMLVDSNNISLLYNNITSERIFERIKELYIPKMDSVLNKLWYN